jgi:hypothetical protein
VGAEAAGEVLDDGNALVSAFGDDVGSPERAGELLA